MGGLGRLKGGIQHNPSQPFVTDSVTDFREGKLMKYRENISLSCSQMESVTPTPTHDEFACEGVRDGFIVTDLGFG